MFDELQDPPSNDKYAAAAHFFMSLKKEAGTPPRVAARQAVRSAVNTNPLPMAARGGSAAKAPQAKATPAAVVGGLQKKAFIGEAVRGLAHAAQNAAPKILKSVGAARGQVAGEWGALKKTVGNYRSGFKDGYNLKPAGVLTEFASRFKKGSGFGTKQKGRFIPIKSRVIIGRKTSPGSEFHLSRLAKKKGPEYTEAFRAGMGTRRGMDPDTLPSAARHFITSKGDITPGSIFKGIHSIGLVNPETTQAGVREAVRAVANRTKRTPSLSKRTGLTNQQMLLGGGTAAGLGYLALRPRKDS